MGVFDNLRTQSAADRLAEEALYAQALREVESGVRRDGIWAKALVEADMDQTKAAAKYISMRVQALKDEAIVQREMNQLRAQQEEVRRLEAAEADLPRHGNGCGGIIVRKTVEKKKK